MIRSLLAVVLAFLAGLGPALADEQQAFAPLGDSLAKAKAAATLVVLRAPDTPRQQGYLTTALSAAEAARQRLAEALAHQDAADFPRQVAAALHALDPQFGAAGGDADYGLRRALSKAADNMRHAQSLSAAIGDGQVAALAAALATAQTRVDEAVDFGRAALVTPSPGVARQAGRAMAIALSRAVDGWDRNGDGKIDWQYGEAGLRQADTAAARIAAGVSPH